MHISRPELKKYFDLKMSGDCANTDFIDEIDAHLSECDDCFREFKAVQALWLGLNAAPDAARKFISDKKFFFKIKIAVDNMLGVLASQIEGLADVCYTSGSAVAVRGKGDMKVAQNNLLLNDLLIADENIRIYCRRDINDTCILTVTSSSKLELNLIKDGVRVSPKYEKYDDVLGEYIVSFRLENGDFDLISG